MEQIIEQLRRVAEKSDTALNKRAGYKADTVTGYLDDMLRYGRVEVGFRQACGRTDLTQHVYREWDRLLKAAGKCGLCISAEPVKHGNAWASLGGGFWSSKIYTLERKA